MALIPFVVVEVGGASMSRRKLPQRTHNIISDDGRNKGETRAGGGRRCRCRRRGHAIWLAYRELFAGAYSVGKNMALPGFAVLMVPL